MFRRQPLAALVTVALVALAAACGAPGPSPGQATPGTHSASLPPPAASPAPPVSPSAAPGATPTPSPSPPPTTPPAATPTPSAAPTASPPPSPAVRPLSEVFGSRRTKVAWSALWAAENALYDRHPELEAAAPRWNLIEQNLRDCGRLQVGTWPDSCGSVVWQDYVLYRHSGLEEAFSVTVLAYQWALGQGIDKAWLDGFVTELVQAEG